MSHCVKCGLVHIIYQVDRLTTSAHDWPKGFLQYKELTFEIVSLRRDLMTVGPLVPKGVCRDLEDHRYPDHNDSS